ncbi:Uncharacterised protein [uncultured archaeon]|nr:Uncharacterised protein [uncultured archaeon]
MENRLVKYSLESGGFVTLKLQNRHKKAELLKPVEALLAKLCNPLKQPLAL